MKSHPEDPLAAGIPAVTPAGRGLTQRSRRAAVIGATAVAGGAIGYTLSLVLGACTTCANGTNPIAFGLLVAAVAGWAAFSAAAGGARG